MATTTSAVDKKKSLERVKSDLPPDWQLVETEDGKKPYFWNTKTGKTSWKFPAAEAEAHKAKVEQHLYQNVRLREKPKPVTSLSSKPASQTEPSDSEYSVVSQDWIKKKKKSTAPEPSSENLDIVPPPLPPRSELADQLEDDKIDEDMYDIPLVPRDLVKVATSDDKSMSSSSITVDNGLYQSAAAKGNTVLPPVEEKPPSSPGVRKASTLKTSEATYDVIGDVPDKKALTLPATRRSTSPEYAVVQQSPTITHPKPNLTSPTSKSPKNSPILWRPPPSAREYDYISIASAKEAATKVVVSESSDEYDLPVTARQYELKVNSPPSPQLSNYAKLQDPKALKKADKASKKAEKESKKADKASKKADKQQWELPKTSKKTRAVSMDVPNSPPTDSVDEAIKALERGLDDPNARINKSQSLDLSNVLDTEPSGDLSLDWDHSDMQEGRESTSAVQLAWMEKHKNMLVQRSYEDVDLPINGGASPSVPDKLRRGWSPRGFDKDDGEKLPAGWSKVVGEDGVYYWHVKSGRTQWKPPKEGDASNKLPASADNELNELKSTLDDLQTHTINYATALTSSNDSADHDSPKTFRAMALGWEEVDETELVRGQMVNVVLACIRRITTTKGDNMKDALATGGQGKEVFIQISGLELRLLDPGSSTVLSAQLINKIRVWGIGVENDRDFGYIARDQSTRRYKCHVFRCQVPAQAVARALVDNHNKERGKKSSDSNHELGELMSPHIGGGGVFNEEHHQGKPMGGGSVDEHDTDAVNESAIPPSLTEIESYQRYECTYLGRVETTSAYGIDTIVESLTKLCADDLKWIEVYVDIASSHIKLLNRQNEDLLQEHRVRFLSFLGINPKDEKYCGYIVDNGDGQFVCHGFMADPNSNKMCISLHSACQSRFQRVLDSQPQMPSTPKEERRNTFSLFKKKSKKQAQTPSATMGVSSSKPSDNETLYKFTVQILGSQSIAQAATLENVKECVHRLSEKFTSSQVKQSTGDFEISSSGLTVIGHQKKYFAKKHYSFKNVTYCVKLKNYFAFVYRESSSKCVCHVFAELEVDAATIVCAIQRTIMPFNPTN
ncbi:uncharacterized protein [Dysidea avara]|uniref:uncharacterized protein isoform X2 n=1 Tax=Dysidea avara TaxID=196820 RepID=UPI003321908F